MKRLTTLAVALTIATSAFAHSRIDTTTPENGTIIGKVPAEISLNFAADIRLTRVDMTYQDRPSVRLDLGDQTRFDQEFTLPFQDMGDGTYRIEWRGLGEDGHAMQGQFTFTVD